MDSQQDSVPAQQDLVLVGGGHAHVEVLRQFAMAPVAGLRITVISRELHTPYSGMLPGFVAGHCRWEDLHIDLAPLCEAAGARLVGDTVNRLDTAARELGCVRHPPLRFDLLSIDCGSAPSVAGIDGAGQAGVPVKPISSFLPRLEALLQRLRAATEPLRIAVVGGGAGGVELSLSLAHRCRAEGLSVPAIRLVTAGPRILEGHAARAAKLMRGHLARANIGVHTGWRVAAADAHGVIADDGRRIDADEILWVTNAAPQTWVAAAGLAVDEAGFVRVDAFLRSVSHPEVFAAGDIAVMDGSPRPRAGVYAVRQGPPLADNLARAATGAALRPFRPQRHALALIGTGGAHAVASRGPLVLSGRWLWWLKQRIDRRFMARYGTSPGRSRPIVGK